MNISKFLLIDAALVIALIPLIYLLKARSQKSYFFKSAEKKEIIEKTYRNLPSKEKILELEKIVIREGNNFEVDSLVGNWKFVSVWKKNNEDDSLFSSLLRAFSANLELKRDISSQNPIELCICASIRFGFFSINFSGSGCVKSNQPFLIYFFNLIEFKSGLNVLFSSSIKETVEKEKSFFEIIESNKSEGWLAARGKGDALILWLKD